MITVCLQHRSTAPCLHYNWISGICEKKVAGLHFKKWFSSLCSCEEQSDLVLAGQRPRRLVYSICVQSCMVVKFVLEGVEFRFYDKKIVLCGRSLRGGRYEIVCEMPW